jgi:hypothetical protein
VTEEEFKTLVGRAAVQNELELVNCLTVGEVGHFLCRVCTEHNLPRFLCGCAAGFSTAECSECRQSSGLHKLDCSRRR